MRLGARREAVLGSLAFVVASIVVMSSWAGPPVAQAQEETTTTEGPPPTEPTTTTRRVTPSTSPKPPPTDPPATNPPPTSPGQTTTTRKSNRTTTTRRGETTTSSSTTTTIAVAPGLTDTTTVTTEPEPTTTTPTTAAPAPKSTNKGRKGIVPVLLGLIAATVVGDLAYIGWRMRKRRRAGSPEIPASEALARAMEAEADDVPTMFVPAALPIRNPEPVVEAVVEPEKPAPKPKQPKASKQTRAAYKRAKVEPPVIEESAVLPPLPVEVAREVPKLKEPPPVEPPTIVAQPRPVAARPGRKVAEDPYETMDLGAISDVAPDAMDLSVDYGDPEL